MRELELDTHQAKKQQRVFLPEPVPMLCPADVFTKLLKCAPRAAVSSVIPGLIQPRLNDEVTQMEANLPIALSDLYNPNNKVLSKADFEHACSCALDSITVTSEEADFLQKTTITQSSCLTWHEYRKGRVTASHFYDVCRHIDSNSQIYPKSIINRIMQYSSNTDHVPALKWGRENEDRARNAYTTIMKSKHQDFNVRPCGLVVDPKFPFAGASPDGLVSCSCCEAIVLEIKCTFKYRNHSPIADEPLADSTFFLKKDAAGLVHLSTRHKYYYQVQGQIALCNVEFCDFVCWTLKDVFISRMLPQLQLFFSKFLLPELLTHSLEPGCSDASKENNQVFCVCRKPESGKMIACDNSNCNIHWFHYKCVGVKRAPRGKWYCSSCKKK